MRKLPDDQRNVDQLQVRSFRSTGEMYVAAASQLIEITLQAIHEKGKAHVGLAWGASQVDLIREWHFQVGANDAYWEQVACTQLDEIVGLGPRDQRSGANWLFHHHSSKVPVVQTFIHGDRDINGEQERLAKLLTQSPLDVVTLGIGESMHLLFNDPSVADFEDAEIVKMIELDPESVAQLKRQGVVGNTENGIRGLTVTLPPVLNCPSVVVAPEARKAAAVERLLNGPINETCPASGLRRAPATLYLDKGSSPFLELESRSLEFDH